MIPILFKISLVACALFLAAIVMWYFNSVIKGVYEKRIAKATSKEELISLRNELQFKQEKVANVKEASVIRKQIQTLNQQLQEFQRKENT